MLKKISRSSYDAYIYYKNRQELSNKRIKRKPFTEDQILVLRQWIEENKDKPYADHSKLNELAEKTKLTSEQVNYWLKNTRFLIRHHGKIRDIKFIENRKVLKEFFTKNNQNPSMRDIKSLSEFTGQSEESIKAWFAKQRFEQKNM
jgi:hypothetical protein